MYSDQGIIISDIESLNKLGILGKYNNSIKHKLKLSADVLKVCRDYYNIKTINLEMIIDDNSIKYIFKDECARQITSVSCKIESFINNGTLTYDVFYSYIDSVEIINMITFKSHTEVLSDFINGINISDHFRKRLHEQFLKRYFCYQCESKWRTKYYVHQQNIRKKDIYNLSELRLNVGYIRFNPNWNLMDMMKENAPGTVRIDIYNDLIGHEYVCISRMLKDIYHGAYYHSEWVRRYLKNKNDFGPRYMIEFEDPILVSKRHKSKHSLFVKVTALPHFLSMTPGFANHILGLYITKLLISSKKI